MFDPMSWLRFWKPRLRNWSVLVVALVWLLSVAGPFTASARASVITTSGMVSNTYGYIGYELGSPGLAMVTANGF